MGGRGARLGTWQLIFILGVYGSVSNVRTYLLGLLVVGRIRERFVRQVWHPVMVMMMMMMMMTTLLLLDAGVFAVWLEPRAPAAAAS